MKKAPISPWIKVCCIQSTDEAKIAADAGATAIGLVSAMPSGPGPIPEATIADIIAAAPAGLQTVLLTSATTLANISDQVRRIGPRAVQLVDHVEADVITGLKSAFPSLTVIDVIHVQTEDDIPIAVARSKLTDALLLDSGAPQKAVKELGGTGRVHDWSLSRRIVDGADCPVWLAGGLNPDNVATAIQAVRPRGVDVCSGLRPNGLLDPSRLAAFAKTVAAAC